MTSAVFDSLAVKGALFTDAATLGLHWLYDQDRLAEIDSQHEILFREPNESDYIGPEGSLGYFAHAAREAGQQSQYGECLALVGRLCGEPEGYSTGAHQRAFAEVFGPGGSYVGYADRPTKALIARLIMDGDSVVAASGSDDDQLPALTSVPALFAAGEPPSTIDSAVQVTSTNSVALDAARTLYRCLTAQAAGDTLSEALDSSAEAAGATLKPLMCEALQRERYAPLEVAQQYGLACHMPQGMPVVWHIAQHVESFEQGVRDNILCGGDSCGRAIALGAILGMRFGETRIAEFMTRFAPETR